MRLLFICLLSLGLSLHSQTLPRWDVTTGVGLSFQLAKVLNQGLSAGPHADIRVAYRVQDTSGLSLFAQLEYLRSSFGDLADPQDAEATFFSLGLRAETHSMPATYNPYLSIAFSYGPARTVLPDPNAEPSLINTAVSFGVGCSMHWWSHMSLEPALRFVVSEGSAVTMPLSCGLRFEL